MTFGEKLQNLRQKAGMSQDALAEQLNVSRQAVSRWERDETMPETDKQRAQRKYEENYETMTEEERKKEEARIKTLDDTVKKKEIVYWYVDKQYEATISIWYYLEDGVCTSILNRFYIN